MRTALHAEWTKLRTVSETWWLLLGCVTLTIGLSAAAIAGASCSGTACRQDPARISLAGVALGQAVAAILGVLAIGSEYSTGMIRTTLAAMPGRIGLLAAKAGSLTAVVLPAAALAVLPSLLIGRLFLPGNGFSASHGFSALSLADGGALRATTGSVLYLVLVSLMSLGVAAAVRDSAVAIGIVLALLYLFPVLAAAVPDPDWHRHLLQLSPMNAGLAVQGTVNLRGLPIGPWAGLGVLTAWAAGALLLGGLSLRGRDA